MSFLGLDGQQKPSCDEGAVFALQNAQLETGGSFMSTSADVATTTFTVSSQLGSISTSFSVVAGYLLWSNDAFDNSTASFCSQNGTILAVFHGAPPSDCSPVALLATLGGMKYSKCRSSITDISRHTLRAKSQFANIVFLLGPVYRHINLHF